MLGKMNLALDLTPTLGAPDDWAARAFSSRASPSLKSVADASAVKLSRSGR